MNKRKNKKGNGQVCTGVRASTPSTWDGAGDIENERAATTDQDEIEDSLPSSPSPTKAAIPGTSWDVSVSPIGHPAVSSQTICLLRFSSLSTVPWDTETNVVVVKVWQDLELTSVGVFLPINEDYEDENVTFKVFSSQGWLLYEQEEEIAELYRTDVDDMGELKLTSPVILSAHRRYYLVMKMGGLPCSAGLEGTYLHCLQTDIGGVQVVFEDPERDELEEFLEDVENLSSTSKGQIPALYLRLPSNKI